MVSQLPREQQEMLREIKLNRHIEITPKIRNGKPRIAGRRITVADIAIAYLRLGQSLEEIAAEYDLTLAEVYAAIAFYYDNKSVEAFNMVTLTDILDVVEQLTDEEQETLISIIRQRQIEQRRDEAELHRDLSEVEEWRALSLEQAMRGLDDDNLPEYTEADLIEKWQ